MPAQATKGKRPKLEPLKVSCDRSDCENELHCFRTSKRKAKHPAGRCQDCGASTVAWDQVKARNLADVGNTIVELQKEWIRHHFWHEPIDQHAVNHALRKGRTGMREAAVQRIAKSVGVKSARDGRQTPWQGNVLYYAQHATACCCRRCIEYWHGVPQDRPLAEEEVRYFAELCFRYVEQRLPTLPEFGQHVPRISKRGGAR